MTVLLWFIRSPIGNVAGIVLAVAVAAGGIYAKGYFAAKRDQRIGQFEHNEQAGKDRRDIERAVPRTDWDDRVDELR